MTVLTQAEACAAWSVADEMLLLLEATRSEPLIMGDFVGLTVKVASGDSDPEVVRECAIRLGVLAMRIAMGETLVVDVKQPEQAA